MPYKTFTAGSVFTAADLNTFLMPQAVMTFTNEAARDAAVTSPTEGMVAYLTAPTVPAVTGNLGAVPTGVITVHNGTNWACITPISAGVTTPQTTTSTSYTDLSTVGPAVTIVTGTQALVTFGALSYPSVGTGSGTMAVAVSGATTLSAPAGDTTNILQFLNTERSKDRTFLITGLTAGTNTFTAKYLGSASTTTSFEGRFLSVRAIA